MNRFGSNSFENENDQFAQNQRVGRLLAENNPRPWNEAPNPNQGFQNRHYSRPSYRPDHPQANQTNYQAPHFYAGTHNDYPANDPAWRHHDDRDWTERNDYKDSDYRYRSGHRGFWHQDYDDTYEPKQHPRHQQHDDSFFTHVGQGIREGWNNLFHRHPEEEYREQRRQEELRNREQNQNRNQNRHWPNSEPGYGRNEYGNQPRNNPPRNEWHNPRPDRRDEDYFENDNWRL